MRKINLNKLINEYEIFLIDQWGVLHNGVKKFIAAEKFLNVLKMKNKKIILISNTSQTKESLINETLIPLRFNPKNFYKIISSGEVIKKIIFSDTSNYDYIKKIIKRKKCLIISNKNDFKNIKIFNLISSNKKNAKFIFAMSIEPVFSKSKIKNLANSLVKLKIPMICTNPDKKVYDGKFKKLSFQVGELAYQFSILGGKVIYIGKPEKIIFEHSLNNIKKKDYKKCIVIGDSLETDIKGGKYFNIDTLLILNGIHKKEFNINKIDEAKKNIKKKYLVKPKFYTPSLESIMANH